MSARWYILSALLALALTITGGLLLSQPGDQPAPQQAETELRIDRESLAQLQWRDLGRMAALAGSSETSRTYTIDLIGQTQRPQAVYLRALLYLANGQAQAAYRHFSTLDPAQLPPRFLYAPFRLAEQFSGAIDNPYQPHLLAAAQAGQLPPLQAGRILARTGYLPDALAAYLKSDPATWRRYDISSLGLLARHSGLAADTRQLLRGAITSQRLQPELQDSLMSLLRDQQPDTLTTEQLRTLLLAGGPTAEAIKVSLLSILDLRRQFLAGDYQGLLTLHADTSPTLASDEETLLLFIAAVASRDSYQTDRWSQELKRRNPDQETRAWISNLLQKPS